jgi:hypothetical protein
MSCGFGVGDHRLFEVDIKTESLVGAKPPSGNVVDSSLVRSHSQISQLYGFGGDKFITLYSASMRARSKTQQISRERAGGVI